MFTRKTLLQNSFTGTATKGPVRHRLSEETYKLDGMLSAEFVVTGTSSKEATWSSSTLSIDSVAVKHPITGATLDFDKFRGFCVRVEKANPASGVSGFVAVIGGDLFTGLDLTASGAELQLGEFSWHSEADIDFSGSGSFGIDLTGTSNYKVSVIIYGRSTS